MEKQYWQHFKDFTPIHFPSTSHMKNEILGSITLKFVCKAYTARKNGLAPIMLQAFIMGKQVRINTDISVNPEMWDDEKQLIKGRSNEVIEWNRILGGMLAKAKNIDIEYRLRNAVLSPSAFEDELKNTSSKVNFLKFMSYQIEKQLEEKDIAESTYKQHINTLKRWKAFKNEIFFTDVNFDLIKDFERFMRNKMKLAPDSIRTSMKNTKKYLKIAQNRGISFDNPFELYKIGESKSRIHFLTNEERSKILKYFRSEFIPENHKAMLRPFLFATFFGGMRYGDWSQLKKSMIMEGKLTFMPEKTKRFKTVVTIPLSDFYLEFVNEDIKSDSLFGWVPAEPYCNRMLKEVATICKINKNLSTHMARHTFGSLFYQATKNLLACSKLMGHTTINQTMQYAHLDDQVLIEEMSAYRQWSA